MNRSYRIYSDSSRESDAWSLPDIRIYCMSATAIAESRPDSYFGILLAEAVGDVADGEIIEAVKSASADLSGWYWQAEFPGCLPDSDPIGPFASSDEAEDDARGGGI